MKFLALIPARGGSKRLPGKNIKLLGGVPLIAWTIRAAKDSGVCVDIVVSTDDNQIAAVARKYGASVPGLRPAMLATDTASSVDVALHALNEYEAASGQIDGLILLQPTSPFRRPDLIQRAVRVFEGGGGTYSVISASPASSHPAWCFRVSPESIMRPFFGWESFEKRSQDLEPAYDLDGAVYIVAPRVLRQERHFISEGSRTVITTDRIESLDIDTPFDWLIAEAALATMRDSIR